MDERQGGDQERGMLTRQLCGASDLAPLPRGTQRSHTSPSTFCANVAFRRVQIYAGHPSIHASIHPSRAPTPHLS
eukprot:366134-Chlamydomonas_euryale.AAC.2